MQHRPELVLGQAGADGLAQLADTGFGCPQRCIDTFHFLGRLDGPCHLHRFLGVDDPETKRLQSDGDTRVEPFEAKGRALACKFGDEIAHLDRPCLFPVTDVGAGCDEAGGLCGANLVDRFVSFTQVKTAGELEKDRAVRGEQQVARRRIAHAEHLHVARAGGIADVDRIAEDDGIDAVFRHLLANPAQAIEPDRPQIDTLALRRPIQKCDVGEVAPLGMPVEIRHDCPCGFCCDKKISSWR